MAQVKVLPLECVLDAMRRMDKMKGPELKKLYKSFYGKFWGGSNVETKPNGPAMRDGIMTRAFTLHAYTATLPVNTRIDLLYNPPTPPVRPEIPPCVCRKPRVGAETQFDSTYSEKTTCSVEVESLGGLQNPHGL